MSIFKNKTDIFNTLLIAILALFLTGDLFWRIGQPATFDGTTHITTMAQFYTGLSFGQFPVTWADGFANYGMPIPLISQQTTNYLGSLINFLLHNILLSFNLVFLLGAFLSTFFFYIFLRCYFQPEVAIIGAYFFNFSAYRIINIYIRGALPEFFASVFIPLMLLGLYLFIKRTSLLGLALLIFATAMIIFTHPFMFIISFFLIGPYAIFLLWQKKKKIKFILGIIAAVILGLGITAGYTIPLFSEVKYFYYGLDKAHLVPNQFFGLQNFFDPLWYYFYKNDVFVRGNFLKTGLLETVIIILGCIASIIALIKKRVTRNPLLIFSALTSLFIIFFLTPFSQPFYQTINLLNGIQHPWRMLGAFIFLPPIILCLLIPKNKYMYPSLFAVALLISFMTFPQLYGKNYAVYPQSYYFFTKENLHGTILNTVWTGKTSEYPVKKSKPGIISGKGKIVKQTVRNGFRDYQIKAETPLRMVDYTFFFPGWRVYIDEQKVPIQYQDPNFRGVITYDVPAGDHHVLLKFSETKERIIGYIVSIVSLLSAGIFIFGVHVIRMRS